MKRIDAVMPEWVMKIACKLNLLPLDGKKILMGVVADVWQIYCKDKGDYIFKKSKFSKEKSVQIANQLRIAKKTLFLPLDLYVYVEEEYLYIVYSMIRGNIQKEFNDNIMGEIYKLLFSIHQNVGFSAIPSIYTDIIRKAEDILMCSKISILKYGEIIKKSAYKIVDKLEYNHLNDMLQCRGILTHGDVKPNNIIINEKRRPILMDWEKLCSVSPEFDLVYYLFYCKGGSIKNIYINKKYNYSILEDCLNYIHDLHLIYDCYVFFNTGERLDYINNIVIPLYIRWEKDKYKYMETII